MKHSTYRALPKSRKDVFSAIYISTLVHTTQCLLGIDAQQAFSRFSIENGTIANGG